MKKIIYVLEKLSKIKIYEKTKLYSDLFSIN